MGGGCAWLPLEWLLPKRAELIDLSLGSIPCRETPLSGSLAARDPIDHNDVKSAALPIHHSHPALADLVRDRILADIG